MEVRGGTRSSPASSQSSASCALANFQRNTAFVAFMIVVVLMCGFSLAKALQGVLVPLIWATFFALPLERAVGRLNDLGLRLGSFVRRTVSRSEVEEVDVVPFLHTPGRNLISVRRTPAVEALVRKLNNPCPDINVPGRMRRRTWASLGCTCALVFKCFKRRIRILKLESRGPAPPPPPPDGVNCLMENWCYHVRTQEIPHLAGSCNLHLQLFLDIGCSRYPAVVEEQNRLGDPQPVVAEVVGTLEVDKTSQLSWAVSVLAVLLMVLAGLTAFVYLLTIGVNALQNSLPDYEKGVSETLAWFSEKTADWLPDKVWADVQHHVLAWMRSTATIIAESVLTGVAYSLFQLILFIIYLLFWLFEPIPVSSSVVGVFKSYLFLKSLVCLLFATLMAMLLASLQCGLWPLFFVITFFLNYIPEIGPLLVAMLSLPAVLFDGSVLDTGRRVMHGVYLVVLGILFKVVTGNVIEVQMYTTKGGEFMRMHSVVLMAMIMIFNEMLGFTGMFLSIPIVAAVKYYIVSSNMPSSMLNPVLCFIEGDETAPHKSHVDRVAAARRRRGLRSFSSVYGSDSLLAESPLLAPDAVEPCEANQSNSRGGEPHKGFDGMSLEVQGPSTGTDAACAARVVDTVRPRPDLAVAR